MDGWYRRAVKSIDRYGRKLTVDQIDFVAGLIDGWPESLTGSQRTVIRGLLQKTVAKRHWPKKTSDDHVQSSKGRKPQAD